MSFVPQPKEKTTQVFYPRLAHLPEVERQASVRLGKLRTKRAAKAVETMKRLMTNFADHIGLMKEKKVAPVSFAYAFGTYMAGIKAFRETAGVTQHALSDGSASPELKSAGEVLKRFADEFKAESQRLLSDATEFLNEIGISPFGEDNAARSYARHQVE